MVATIVLAIAMPVQAAHLKQDGLWCYDKQDLVDVASSAYTDKVHEVRHLFFEDRCGTFSRDLDFEVIGSEQSMFKVRIFADDYPEVWVFPTVFQGGVL